ncbi:MAG: hypothetical protein PHY91_03165 [Tissierellia bacterium]|nr:hypothetical protein [Tissierellia bacterium]
MIQCSEKCIHESDGLCSLKEVTHPSKTPKKDCPYYNNKHNKNEETPPPLH